MAHSSPGYPRYEDLDLDEVNYRQEMRWRLFVEPSERGDPSPSKSVLVSMGEFWTVLDGREFRRLAERILGQL